MPYRAFLGRADCGRKKRDGCRNAAAASCDSSKSFTAADVVNGWNPNPNYESNLFVVTSCLAKIGQLAACPARKPIYQTKSAHATLLPATRYCPMLVEQGGADVIKRLLSDKSTQMIVLELCESITKSLFGEGLISQG